MNIQERHRRSLDWAQSGATVGPDWHHEGGKIYQE